MRNRVPKIVNGGVRPLLGAFSCLHSEHAHGACPAVTGTRCPNPTTVSSVLLATFSDADHILQNRLQYHTLTLQISTQLPHGYSSLGNLPCGNSPPQQPDYSPDSALPCSPMHQTSWHFHWSPSIPCFLCLESPHLASTATPFSPSSLGKILFILPESE